MCFLDGYCVLFGFDGEPDIDEEAKCDPGWNRNLAMGAWPTASRIRKGEKK